MNEPEMINIPNPRKAQRKQDCRCSLHREQCFSQNTVPESLDEQPSNQDAC